MNSYGLTRENLLSGLPVALRQDESVLALADAIAQTLAMRPEEIDRLRIYPAIGRLDETMLDILAYDFKVDWWDGDYSLEEKRRTLEDSWNVHRTLGTRYAVETALGAVLPGARVGEWFEYGGTPYCFRLDIPLPEDGLSIEKQRRVISRIWYYKNLRSHLESVNIQAETTGFLRVGACTAAIEVMEIWPELTSCMEISGEARTGMIMLMNQSVDVYPELIETVSLPTEIESAALTAARQTVEIYPE